MVQVGGCQAQTQVAQPLTVNVSDAEADISRGFLQYRITSVFTRDYNQVKHSSSDLYPRGLKTLYYVGRQKYCVPLI